MRKEKRVIPKKPVPDLIGDGYRISAKIMRIGKWTRRGAAERTAV